MLARAHSFAYDGNIIVLECISLANGETHTIENFWGNDLSGSEDGAGGVGGLLAVSVDGTYCFPCYGNNGNVTRYIGEDGSVVARFVYDPYGNIIEQSGPLAELLAIRFCTKYTDSEVELVSYLRRFYDAFNGRWLNRDPIEEEGGANLFVFALNNPVVRFDTDGCFVLPIMINPDPTPPPPSDPSPSIVDQFGFAPLPSGEEKWFERNYAGWLAEARRRFSAEIDRGIDCKSTSFNGPSSRINIEPSENRSGSTSNRTPGSNERQYGDAGQSDWSADKVLGSFSIDYVTPVKITYTNMGGGKRRYNWSAEMYVYDVLGTQEYDPIRRIPVVGDIVGSLTPSRGVKRATWTLSGSGECDCNGRN